MATDPQVATVTDLLKRSQGQLFGKYRGLVIDHVDPDKRGRLKLQIPSVFGTETTDWVIGAFPFGGSSNEGMIFIPAVGSHVLVEFIEGDKSSPVWTATYYPADGSQDNKGVPPESFDQDQGLLHAITTEMGLELRMEDNRLDGEGDRNQQFIVKHPLGSEIMINKEGVITLIDAGGAEVMLDPENNILRVKGHGDGILEMVDDALKLNHGSSGIEITSSGVTITAADIKLDGDQVGLGKNASAPVMDAQAFVNAYIGHVHPCPTGSTSPFAPPNPALLQTVSLSKVTGA
jgi:hypothetical protein